LKKIKKEKEKLKIIVSKVYSGCKYYPLQVIIQKTTAGHPNPSSSRNIFAVIFSH